jgi:ubiquinone biosynthesis protein COQ9
MEPAMTHDEMRERLMLASLIHVGFDGWTRRALLRGAHDAAIEPGLLDVLFPGGADEALTLFSGWADRRMAESVAAEGEAFAARRTRDRVARAAMIRFDLLLPYRDAVRRGVARSALRPGAVTGGRRMWRTADAIWVAAGDTATDSNFYSKRALLCGVLGPTTLVWLGDDTEGSTRTRAFLERRIADVLAVGRRTAGLGRIADAARAPFRLARRCCARRAAA